MILHNIIAVRELTWSAYMDVLNATCLVDDNNSAIACAYYNRR